MWYIWYQYLRCTLDAFERRTTQRARALVSAPAFEAVATEGLCVRTRQRLWYGGTFEAYCAVAIHRWHLMVASAFLGAFDEAVFL